MNPLFENRYTYSLQTMKEIYRAYYFKNWGKTLILLLYILLVIACIYNPAEGSVSFYGLRIEYLCIVAIVVIFIQFNSYSKGFKIAYGRDMEFTQGRGSQMVITITDHIIMHNIVTGGTQHIDFRHVHKTIETKTLFLIITRNRALIMLRRECFSIGTRQDFRDFASKYLKLRHAKKD